MRNEMQIINNMEVNCFELILLFNKHNRKTIMEMLTQRLQSALKVPHVEMIIYNRWHLHGESKRFSHLPEKKLVKLDVNVFYKYFNDLPNIKLIDQTDELIFDGQKNLEDQTTKKYFIKLNSKYEFSGLLYLGFSGDDPPSDYLLNSVKLNVNDFLTVFYNHRDDRYMLKRNRTIFNLSSELHSVHETDDLLRRVLASMKLLFPNFDFTFLMSSEYGDSNLPVKFIEYEAERTLTPGIKAFINNELEIVRNKEDNTTIFYVPLSGEQSVYGVIQGTAPYNLEFSQSLISFINNSSKMIGKALERTMIYQESTNRVADLQLINQTTHRLNSNLNKDEIISIINEKINYSCYPESIVTVFFDENGQKEIIGGENAAHFHTLTGHVFIDYVLAELRKTDEAIFLGELIHEELNTPFNSLMAFPLKSSHDLMGVMIVVHTQSYYFSFDRFKLIQSIVQHGALALSNSLLKDQLSKTVITDYLTQLYSRNHLDEVIADHMKKGEFASFVLFDIDNFKLVNDTYGHYIGDKVLQKIAEIIEETIDKAGIAARWGGEEFAIYLPEINIDEAVKLANYLRSTVKNKTTPQVSISCGVSKWEKSMNEDIKSLFVRTDKALYEAKESGKNKVVTDVLKEVQL